MIINGIMIIVNCSIESLGNLKEVNGNLDLSWNSNLKTLGNLEKVNGLKFNTLGNLNLFNCRNLKDLGNLQFVYHSLFLGNCKNLKTLGKLSFAYRIYLKDSGVTEEYIRKEKPKLLGNCKWI
jgi:hypothetical protein